jgi:hypothetical protein
MTREHSSWLSRMLRQRRMPVRIPVRKVSEGGFARLMATEPGRQMAADWWHAMLDRLE